MKRFNFLLDDESAKVLEGSPNKSETIRQALLIHNNGISTDTIHGFREAFKEVRDRMEKMENYLAALAALTAQIADKTKVAYDPTQFSDWGA